MFRRLLSALILVPLAVLAHAQPAAALPGIWPGGAICATGTLTAGPRPSSDPFRTPLEIRIQPCPGESPEAVTAARWGMARYFDGAGYAELITARPFAGSGVTEEEVLGFYDGSHLTEGSRGTLRAVCVVAGTALTRTACIHPELDAAGRIVITPVPVDAPMVTVPTTVFRAPPHDPNPECGACV